MKNAASDTRAERAGDTLVECVIAAAVAAAVFAPALAALRRCAASDAETAALAESAVKLVEGRSGF